MTAQLERKLTSKEAKFLSELKIQLHHEVPKVHTLEKYPYTKGREYDTNRFVGYSIKTTIFNAKEDEIILKNWAAFCKIHKWDSTFSKPFTRMNKGRSHCYIPEPENRIRFVQFLANGLFDRTLTAVYRRFRTLLERTSVFTDFQSQEDKVLYSYLKKFPSLDRRHFIHAATILGRRVPEVEKRYKQLLAVTEHSTRKTEKSIVWNLERLTRFLQNLMELTLSKDVIELKNAKIPQVVFEKLQERMKISRLTLQKKWFEEMHLQLFSPEPIYLNEIKIKLIRLLNECGYTDSRTIPWEIIVQFFEGVSDVLLKNLFNQATDAMKHRFNMKRSDLSIIKRLEKDHIPDLEKNNVSSFKKRLQYHKNELRIHPDDMKNDLAKFKMKLFEKSVSSKKTESSNFSERENNLEDDQNEFNNSSDKMIQKTSSDKNRITSELISIDEASKGTSVDDGIGTGSAETNNDEELWEKESNSSIDPEKEKDIQITLTPELSSKLVKNLLDLTKSRDVKQLKLAVIPKVVWKKLQEILDVSWNELRKIWSLRLHVQLFSPDPIYLNDIKIDLIELLNKIGPTNITEIEWTELAYYFDGTTPEFLKSIFHSLANTIIGTRVMPKNLEDVLKHLQEREILELSQSKVDKCLKRLEYVDGTIRIIPLI